MVQVVYLHGLLFVTNSSFVNKLCLIWTLQPSFPRWYQLVPVWSGPLTFLELGGGGTADCSQLLPHAPNPYLSFVFIV